MKKNDDSKGIVLILFSLFIVGGALFAAWKLAPTEVDKATLCPITGPKAHTILLIDKSDKWNNSQIIRLKRLIHHLKNEIKQHELLSIFVFKEAIEYGFKPTFELCSPGRGDEINELVGNPKRIQKQFLDKFSTPLNEILISLTKAENGDTSPLLEVLADITNRDEFRDKSQLRKIILISDMMQNTDTVSLYLKDNITNEEISKYDNIVGGISLKTFSIVVYQIRGSLSSNHTLNKAKAFWLDLFSLKGAKSEWKYL